MLENMKTETANRISLFSAREGDNELEENELEELESEYPSFCAHFVLQSFRCGHNLWNMVHEQVERIDRYPPPATRVVFLLNF
mgnify:CR=1 FL=1